VTRSSDPEKEKLREREREREREGERGVWCQVQVFEKQVKLNQERWLIERRRTQGTKEKKMKNNGGKWVMKEVCWENLKNIKFSRGKIKENRSRNQWPFWWKKLMQRRKWVCSEKRRRYPSQQHTHTHSLRKPKI